MREMNVHLIDNTRISATLGLYFHIKYLQVITLRKILTIVAKEDSMKSDMTLDWYHMFPPCQMPNEHQQVPVKLSLC